MHGMIPGQGMHMSGINGMNGMNGIIPVITDGVNTFQLTQMVMLANPPAMRAMQAFGPLRGTRVSHRTGSGHGELGYDNLNRFRQAGIPIVYNVDQ